MHGFRPSLVLSLTLQVSIYSVFTLQDGVSPLARGYQGNAGIRLPIYRQETRSWRPRSNGRGEVELNEYLDVTYNVLITLGNTTTRLIIDTGSSDLWAISSASSSAGSSPHVPLYAGTGFKSTGVDGNLEYGDSRTGTHAYGLIGSDTVSLAGFTLRDQFFLLVNDTNTTVSETGSAGIMGLGFPLNSVVWRTVFLSRHENVSQASDPHDNPRPRSRPYALLGHDLASRSIPDLSCLPLPLLSCPTGSPHDNATRFIHEILASYATLGPFMSRLVVSGSLASPLFTVLLQRETDDVGGNPGILTVGGLPAGINRDEILWVAVRAYPPSQGGLNAPSDAPNEVYPIAWEIPIDNVFLDGQRMPRSALSSPNITLSALIDTGNSFIRGPSDVIEAIYNKIGNKTFPCDVLHTLSFQIGGKMFPVDPRDFARQVSRPNVSLCQPNLAVTDSPMLGRGFLHSWSLGDPFLKSVFAAFYFGNLSYPSKDPPRIGLLSTIPTDAGVKTEAAVSAASPHGGSFLDFVMPPKVATAAIHGQPQT